MMAAARHPILLLGGSGSLGSKLARTLRRMHPRQPIAIATAPLLLQDGRWVWQGGSAAQRRFTSVDGIVREGTAVALVDTLGIANATGARSVRLDIAEGRTASSLQGGPAWHEVIIEIAGERKDGSAGRFRYELVDNAGYAAMSARGIALAVDLLLGLDGGAPAAAGLYLPEVLLAPEAIVRQLAAFDVRISGPYPANQVNSA